MTLKRMVIHALVVLLATSLTELLRAEVPLKSYAESRNTEPFKSYLIGIGKGIFWTNTFLGARSLPALFCLPGKLEFDGDIILSIIDQEVENPTNKKGYYGPDDPIEAVAVQAFVGRFPCK